MPRLCLSYLLGVWLLLSQLPRDISGENPDDIVKACGRELVRRRIQICGSINWKKKPVSLQEPGLDAEPPTEIMASSITKDAEALNTMLECTPNLPQELKATLSERQPSLRELQRPALKDLDLNFEEFKEILLNRPSVAEDNSLLELKNLGLDKHSRKKRMIQVPLIQKCCFQGCTVKELAIRC